MESTNTDSRTGDMKNVNLSDFTLTPDHISLIQRGMSFSPVTNMDEFTVYNDITLFLRKAFLRSLHERKDNQPTSTMTVDAEDQRALDILNSLLKENEGPLETTTSVRRQANLGIRSLKMPPLSKNKWLNLFLDMVQTDLEKVDWTKKAIDNLTAGERQALNDLSKRKNIAIKNSDKGGNMVLLNQQHYEKEAKKLLNDRTTYNKLDHNPFPEVVWRLNQILLVAKDEGLLTIQEFQYLTVCELYLPFI